MALLAESFSNQGPHTTDHATIARSVNVRHGVAAGAPAAGQTYQPDVGVAEAHIVTLPASGAVTIGPAVSSDANRQWLPGAEVRIHLVVPNGSTATVTWDASWAGAPTTVAAGVYRFANTQAAADTAPTWTYAGGSTQRFSALADVNMAGLADGQIPVWNAAAGAFLPGSQTGPLELTYSENATGTLSTAVTSTPGAWATGPNTPAIASTDITVPVSTRPVYLEGYLLAYQVGTAVTGLVGIEIWETTGTPVFFARTTAPLPNSVAGTLRNVALYHPPVRLGAVPSPRSFQLRLNVYGNSGNPSAQAANFNSPGFKSWLRAVAS